MSNDYTPSRLIPIEEFKNTKWERSPNLKFLDIIQPITLIYETTESEFFDDNFLIRQGEGKESKYLTVYVKEGYVIGFTMGGDPTGNQLLEIIQKTFDVKMIDFNYHWQHSL